MQKQSRILIACEESGTVTNAFVDLGYMNVYSCDLLPTSGRYPERHIQDDVLRHLEGWDMILAFPPCTYLSVAGNRWLNVERYGEKALERLEKQKEAFEFFMKFIDAPCEKICVENPVGAVSRLYRKPDQYIQPWEYGHPTTKKTCLWLKGLPLLVPTNIVEPTDFRVYKSGAKPGRKDSSWHMDTLHMPKEERALARSKTFPGIAKAMAAQWGEKK
ncbi:MAG: hypothetical protein FWG30_11535 [Eubacteriaceae bacterium]|nr:hypothetical protein [Eubacteriaceae bacterium]